MRNKELFWKKVQVDGDECWPWLGVRTTAGYGQWHDGDRKQMAHRVMWELVFGSIPEGLTIDHLCGSRNCVNPNHLDVTSQRENTLRGNTLPARNAVKTHCDNGHEFIPENTRITKEGFRRCRKCQAEWARKNYV